MTAEPGRRRSVGCGLGRLAQDVGIDQVFHRESVDSEAMG